MVGTLAAQVTIVIPDRKIERINIMKVLFRDRMDAPDDLVELSMGKVSRRV